MLAQSFMKPEALGITEQQIAALIKVLGMLERGELRHVSTRGYATGASVRPATGLFNMNRWSVHFNECGTVCCIGGSAEAIGRFQFPDDIPAGLKRLFYPGQEFGFNNHPRENLYESITTQEAAAALRNYLTTGEPCWAEAIAR